MDPSGRCGVTWGPRPSCLRAGVGPWWEWAPGLWLMLWQRWDGRWHRGSYHSVTEPESYSFIRERTQGLDGGPRKGQLQ